MKTITVEFESGYECDVNFDPENLNTEYWVEITERQNPYDASDIPIAIVIDGSRVALDNDGAWLGVLDEYLDVD